jgi:hypothetical protein
MRLQVGGKSYRNAPSNGKATLAASQRSFIAGWKLCAGAALGLCLAARSSSALTTLDTASRKKSSCFLPGTRIKTTEGRASALSDGTVRGAHAYHQSSGFEKQMHPIFRDDLWRVSNRLLKIVRLNEYFIKIVVN